MLQDEEHQQQYGVQDLPQLVAGRRVHFQGSTQPQGNDPLLLFVEGSRNINNILSPPFPPPLLLSAPPHPPPPPHHHHSYQYYDNLSNINSILGGHHLQVGGGGVGGILESTPPLPCHGHGNHGWNINNVSEGDGNGNGTNSRWPRQETLTLLEIRSRLDPKFKEANQKAPLWDDVSRIMGEEHGYYRSGKKCREKFENLYKYYKKTKEGKAGRQDGKHYRFFRQLEALYGDTSTTFPPQLINYTTTTITPSNWSAPPPNPTTEDDDDHEPLSIQENQQQSLSTNFSNTTTTSQEFDQYQTTTSSSENNNIDIKMNNNDDQDLSAIACSMMMNRSSSSGKSLAAHDQVIKSSKKKSTYNWKVEKVKGFVELEMRRLVEAQEVWMERIVRMIEVKEKERLCREEEWTKQEVARLDGEHEVWAKERAWMEARDACFLETFKKYTAKFTHAAGNNRASSTSSFDEDMMMKNNNLSCVGTGSASKLAKLHEGQELWSSYELKKEMMNKEKKPLLYK